LATTETKLELLRYINLVGHICAKVVCRQVINGAGVLGVPQKDEACSGSFRDHWIKNIHDAGEIRGGADGMQALMPRFKPGEQRVPHSQDVEIPDWLKFVVKVAQVVVLPSQLTAGKGNSCHSAAIAVAQNGKLAIHVRKAVGDGEIRRNRPRIGNVGA